MKRTVYILAGVAFLLAAVFCGVKVLKETYAPQTVLSEEIAAATGTPALVEAEVEDVPEDEEEEEPVPTAVTDAVYTSDIDFAALQSVNPDIYAWIEIDNTNISYPVVQSPGSNSYYLTHNSDGNYSANGAIYSEDYNALDFSDPVTILYGHHMKSGAMFGKLQQYFSDSSFFEENEIIRIYTEDETLEYGVFAAVPYSNEHILYYNDFTDESVFTSFFSAVLNTRDLEAQYREEYAPEAGDRVLILSTCLASNNSRRFLVMATLLG